MTTALTNRRPTPTGALASAAVDIAHLPVAADTPLRTFDRIAADLGVELWPLPEFSHEQFLADRRHTRWLNRWTSLERTLRVVDLEEPYRVVPIVVNVENDLILDGFRGYCVLCNHQTKPSKQAGTIYARIERHVRRHGWVAPSELSGRSRPPRRPIEGIPGGGRG